jgi:hypothetical protein
LSTASNSIRLTPSQKNLAIDLHYLQQLDCCNQELGLSSTVMMVVCEPKSCASSDTAPDADVAKAGHAGHAAGRVVRVGVLVDDALGVIRVGALVDGAVNNGPVAVEIAHEENTRMRIRHVC